VKNLDAEQLLTGAFPLANELLAGLADPADVMPHLQAYVASLVSAKAEHSREKMQKWLEHADALA
jgi:hypothetical protein